jgi:hypothetical protein
MEACSKALAVLSSDDAHDLFTKTFNPSLLQKENSMHSERRAQASKLLSDVARKMNNPRLATLAVRVRLDAFTRVKKAIDDMVAQLTKEKADEIKHKDFCVDEFNTNELQTEKKERAKQDLIAKIADLEQTIKALTEAIDKLKAEIAEMQVQMKRAGEDREKERVSNDSCGSTGNSEVVTGRSHCPQGFLRQESRHCACSAGACRTASTSGLQGVQEQRRVWWGYGNDPADHQRRKGNGSRGHPFRGGRSEGIRGFRKGDKCFD